MRRVLFICSQNKLRSPTAEQVFSTWPQLEVASAGLNHDAITPVTPDLLEWAELIFVMEQAHRTKLSKKFRCYLKNRRVVCLGIPDKYGYMEQALVDLLIAKAGPFLRR
ncbi:MAG: phosphotyrosine protein phosphatase [bacterium]|nr:phosphotyrosine protein phosphatase [bacterium]